MPAVCRYCDCAEWPSETNVVAELRAPAMSKAMAMAVRSRETAHQEVGAETLAGA